MSSGVTLTNRGSQGQLVAVQVSTPSLGVILATYKDWLVHMYNFQNL